MLDSQQYLLNLTFPKDEGEIHGFLAQNWFFYFGFQKLWLAVKAEEKLMN